MFEHTPIEITSMKKSLTKLEKQIKLNPYSLTPEIISSLKDIAEILNKIEWQTRSLRTLRSELENLEGILNAFNGNADLIAKLTRSKNQIYLFDGYLCEIRKKLAFCLEEVSIHNWKV